MQENNKKDEDNHGRDVDKFRDNAEGTTSLKEFLEQVGRCGENVAPRLRYERKTTRKISFVDDYA